MALTSSVAFFGNVPAKDLKTSATTVVTTTSKNTSGTDVKISAPEKPSEISSSPLALLSGSKTNIDLNQLSPEVDFWLLGKNVLLISNYCTFKEDIF